MRCRRSSVGTTGIPWPRRTDGISAQPRRDQPFPARRTSTRRPLPFFCLPRITAPPRNIQRRVLLLRCRNQVRSARRIRDRFQRLNVGCRDGPNLGAAIVPTGSNHYHSSRKRSDRSHQFGKTYRSEDQRVAVRLSVVECRPSPTPPSVHPPKRLHCKISARRLPDPGLVVIRRPPKHGGDVGTERDPIGVDLVEPCAWRSPTPRDHLVREVESHPAVMVVAPRPAKGRDPAREWIKAEVGDEVDEEGPRAMMMTY